MDFSFITKRLATGAAISSPADVDALVGSGVTHIIDCRDDFNDQPLLASRIGVQYLWNPTADDGARKPVEWFKRSIDFALPALALPYNKVYCHCKQGINRGPSTAYCVLRALGLGRFEARAALQIGRPIALARYAADADNAIAALGYE